MVEPIARPTKNHSCFKKLIINKKQFKKIYIIILFFKGLSMAQHLLEKTVKTENSNNSKGAQPLQSPTSNSEIRPIIILSTFRSGSTLTGDILQQAQDSFYLYEPLNPLNYLMYGVQNTTRLQLVNGSTR